MKEKEAMKGRERCDEREIITGYVMKERDERKHAWERTAENACVREREEI